MEIGRSRSGPPGPTSRDRARSGDPDPDLPTSRSSKLIQGGWQIILLRYPPNERARPRYPGPTSRDREIGGCREIEIWTPGPYVARSGEIGRSGSRSHDLPISHIDSRRMAANPPSIPANRAGPRYPGPTSRGREIGGDREIEIWIFGTYVARSGKIGRSGSRSLDLPIINIDSGGMTANPPLIATKRVGND